MKTRKASFITVRKLRLSAEGQLIISLIVMIRPLMHCYHLMLKRESVMYGYRIVGLHRVSIGNMTVISCRSIFTIIAGKVMMVREIFVLFGNESLIKMNAMILVLMSLYLAYHFQLSYLFILFEYKRFSKFRFNKNILDRFETNDSI